MREIDVKLIRDAICSMVRKINIEYPSDICESMEQALSQEDHPIARSTLEFLMKNAEIAKAEKLPICQDTGMAVVFLNIGQDVHLVGGSLQQAVNDGVALGYEQGYQSSMTRYLCGSTQKTIHLPSSILPSLKEIKLKSN